jgi:4-hydroxy-tetrahydrodipicolinate synthase
MRTGPVEVKVGPRLAAMIGLPETTNRLRGISAIPVTPFDDTLALDEPALRRVIDRLVGFGLEVIVPCGNTSEYWSLEDREAEATAATTIEQVGGRATVLVGVGGQWQKAADQARIATARGAAGVMIHAPRDPYLSTAGLITYYSAVADSTDGAVAIYLRDCEPADAVLDRVLALPNVVAVKYAIPNVMRFAELRQRYEHQAVWLCGLAEAWAPFFWLAGARGFTSGLVNVHADGPLALLTALRAGDYVSAMNAWRTLMPFEQLRARHSQANNVVTVKTALAILDVCQAHVRPPLAPLSESDRLDLSEIVTAMGIERAPALLTSPQP